MATVAARTNSTRGAGPANPLDEKAPRGGARSAARTPSNESPAAQRGDLVAIESFLQSLARAVRQFHTYPATSPRCIDAVEECHRALGLVEVDAIACVVSPRELLVSGQAIGRGTLVEQELARRLYESRCQTVDIDRTASRRDIGRLCTELAARHDSSTAFADRLRNQGVDRISFSAAYQPELFDITASTDTCVVVEEDRLQQDFQPPTGRVAHLYPADRGWVRVDPGLPLRQITLSGLARLVEDPGSLAQMLSRLAGDTSDRPLSPADALEQRCEDVARLYTSLDPAVARARFARLASAVLTLESQQRRRLLSTTVLPALIDGRPEGDLLRDFPDVDLADALSLLLDVETAAPELLTSALDRLHLSPERHGAVAPLLEERINARLHDATAARKNDEALRERTQQLIRVVTGDASFHDFAAFDLCIDDATERIIAGTNDAMHATNIPDTQLACVIHLIALNANPEVVERLLRDATRLLGELEKTQSWDQLISHLEALQRSSAAFRDSRPEVSAAIAGAIEHFYTPARFEHLIALYDAGGDQRAIASRLVAAVGSGLTAAVVRGLQDGSGDKRVLQLVCEHAVTFAATLARLLDELPVPQRIAAIRALAAAGHGFETQLGRQLTHQNEGVVREALRALSRVGSEEAAEFITRHIQRCGSAAGSAAEEALWHFAPAVTRQCVRSLLRQRPFVIANPDITLRLLERVDRLEPSKLSDVLSALTSLRFRFWNPRLARIGRKAAALLQP